MVKTRGHPFRLTKVHVSLDQLENYYLFNRMAEAWNRLPVEVVVALSVNAFKGRFDRRCADWMHVTDQDQLYISHGEMDISQRRKDSV